MTSCRAQLLCKVYDDPEHGLGANTCPGSSTLKFLTSVMPLNLSFPTEA